MAPIKLFVSKPSEHYWQVVDNAKGHYYTLAYRSNRYIIRNRDLRDVKPEGTLGRRLIKAVYEFEHGGT